MQYDPNFIGQLRISLETGMVKAEVFGEEHLEGIRTAKPAFCPNTGKRLDDRCFAVAPLELATARLIYAKRIEEFTRAQNDLEWIIEHFSSADRSGDGVVGMDSEEFLAEIDDLKERAEAELR